MKRLLSAFLALLFVAYLTPFPILPSAAEEEIPSNAILITSVEELDRICNEYPADGYYILACDLDFSQALSEYGDFYHNGQGWTPIGTQSVPFSGTFDGCGHKITGFSVQRTTEFVGLFGCADGATIKNISFENPTVSGGDALGVLLGYGNNVTLINCHTTGGTLTATGSYAGGIAGKLENENGIAISNCSNSTTVSAQTYAAGIVGYISGTSFTIESCDNDANISGNSTYLGGIAAYSSPGTFYDCNNSGNITGAKAMSAYVGGIAGSADTLVSCSNAGAISASLQSVGTDEGSPHTGYAGGIAGYANAISKSSNLGSTFVSGGSFVTWTSVGQVYTHIVYTTHYVYAYGGGIAGTCTSISECYNSAAHSIADSKNSAVSALVSKAATVTDSYSCQATQPLVNQKNATITHCYNTDGIIAAEGTADSCYYYAEAASGIGELRTRRQLRIKSTFTGWDFEKIWTMEGNEDYLYPELNSCPSTFHKTLVGISIAALPEKTTYIEQKNESLDLTGAKLRLTYDNEMTEVIPITAEMVSGFDNTVIGTQNIKVAYCGLETSFSITIVSKSLVSIELTALPEKLKYLEGKDTLDVTGGVLALYYNNDTSETKPLAAYMVTGFDNTVVGPQELTVTYISQKTTFDIEIIAKSLTGIEVSKLPTKTNYLEGKDDLNLAGGKLALHFDNDSTVEIDLSDSEVTVTGFNNQTLGVQTLTVHYRGFAATFEVTVNAKSVSYIVIAALPDTLTFLEEKDGLSVSGGQIHVFYNNDTDEIVEMQSEMISGFDNSKVGKQTLIVTYGGKTTAYEVEIIAKTLIDMEIRDLPEKLTYLEHKDLLDLTGGRIALFYNNDTTEVIDMSEATVTGFDNTVIGSQTLTVSYRGFTATYEIEIVEKHLASIGLTTQPDKLTYLEGKDPLDVTGGKITLFYDNDTQETVDLTADMVSGFDNTKIGNQTLTITYEGKTTTYVVTIIAKTLLSITIETEPTKKSYLEGESLDVSGGVIAAVYNNGERKLYDITTEMVSGFDSSKGVHSQILTVNFGGKTATYTIEILHSYISSITLPTCTEQGYTTYTCSFCGDRYFSNFTEALGHTPGDPMEASSDAWHPVTTVADGDEIVIYYPAGGTALGTSVNSNNRITPVKVSLSGGLMPQSQAEAAAILTVEFPADDDSNFYLRRADGAYLTTNSNGNALFYQSTANTYSLWYLQVQSSIEKTVAIYSKYASYGGNFNQALEYYSNGFTTYGWNNNSNYVFQLFRITDSYSDPTCTEVGGYDSVICCTVCGAELSREHIEVPALGHDYQAKVTSPTCTDAGFTTYTCSRCGDSYIADEISALGHTPSDPITVNEVAATCESAGGYDTIVYCTVCDAEISHVHTETPATGHNWSEPIYTWASDNSEVTAMRVCIVNTEHIESETVKTTTEITREATYDAEGEVTYTASFTNSAFSPQTQKIPTPKLDRPVLTNPFEDVKDGAYYYDAVLWAVNANPQVTAGTSATTFSPNATCTRAQVVTFLWRASGQPEPTKTDNPFKDVKEGAYYYKAVLWAVENGVTAGTSATTFSPNQGCTRAQVVTFLWRTHGQPEPTSSNNPFKDVTGGYYYTAVLWAVENKITAGTSATTFSPNQTCTRGQIVTFLYRDLG